MPQKPASAIVFGVLNIGFGVLGLCGTIFALVSFAVPQDPTLNNPVLDIMQKHPEYALFNKVAAGIGFVASMLAIAAGIGLLQLKSWGRTLSIVYAVYGIVAAIVTGIVNYIYLIGPLMRMADQLEGPEKAQAQILIGSTGLGPCISLIYPVVLLIFMNTETIKRAFSRGAYAHGAADENWQS